MATAFNSQGATPQTGSPFAGGMFASTPNPFAGTTPQSKALSSAGSGLMTSIIPQNTPAFPASSAPALPPTAAGSSTGLGSLTHPGILAAQNSVPTSLTTSSDGQGGTTVKATYASDEEPAAAATPTYSSSGGAVIPTGGAPGTPLTPQTPATPTPQPTTASIPTTFPGITTGLVGAAQGNLPIGANAQQIGQYYGGLINATGNLGAGTIEGDLTSGAPTSVGQGNANIASEAESNRISSLGTAEQAALAGTGQQLTAQQQEQQGLTSAGGLLTPSNQFVQVSPGNYLADSTGNAVAGGQAAGIENATNWAIAQQNMQQGQDYQGQAQAISNALQTLSPVQQAITPYMSANNLDSNGVPFANQQINAINAQANPAAYATMQAAISEARSYAIQLLGSQSGANPTDVTNSVSSYDFNNFTPTQLNTFLNNLATLGQYRLSQAQSASQAGYGANAQVGTPAEGETATTGTPLQSGGANALNNQSDLLKYFEGLGLNIGSAVTDAASGAASNVVAGAAGGAAESAVTGAGSAAASGPTAATVLGI